MNGKRATTVLLVLAGTGSIAHAVPQEAPATKDAPVLRREIYVGEDEPLPEALRKHLKLPPGATVKDLPPSPRPKSPASKKYFRALSSLSAEVEASVPARVDAVLAWEQLGLLQESWQLDRSIRLGKPLSGDVAAGTVFVREVREIGGEELYCIARASGEMYKPFVNARRAIYPSLCLFDSDKDGSPDSYKAEPYLPENPVIIQPIGQPVAWTPLTAQSDSPHAVAVTLTRQLRVGAVDAEQVTLVSQLQLSLRGVSKPVLSSVPDWPAVELSLRDGEQTVVDGITVRVAKVDGQWHLRSSGRFLPWAELRSERNGYRILPSKASTPER